MVDLVSILNSGESLEKAVVLTKLALKENSDFYVQYDNVRILYFENLPRRRNSPRSHGTIGGLFENINIKKQTGYNSYEDLWDDKNKVLDILLSKERITERMKEKLLKDKGRYIKTVLNLPWYFVFDEFKEKIKRLLNETKISLEYVDFKKISFEVIDRAPNPDWWSRPYILNPDGIVSSRYFWKGWSREANKNQREPIQRSIVLSPNVHLFLKGIYYHFCEQDKKVVLGFRRFKRFQRNSYDQGTEFLLDKMISRCVEEPRNVLFNRLLDKVDTEYGFISPERKTNLAVYQYLNEII
ncbi:MAG: hypothetical protein AABY22_02090 [Nanoarchaeota archaeon]